MIKAKRNRDGSYTVTMDAVEHIVIARLAKDYSISRADMLVGIINKGIDMIKTRPVPPDDEHRPMCHG